MSEHDVLKKNRNFYIGVGGTVLEGLLSGSLFMLLYSVMQFLWSGQFDMNRALILTGVIAVIFLLRILIYSYGYTKAQIGGAEVSKNIRLFMGDHLKRIPLSRFTQGQTGDYINCEQRAVRCCTKSLRLCRTTGQRQGNTFLVPQSFERENFLRPLRTQPPPAKMRPQKDAGCICLPLYQQ